MAVSGVQWRRGPRKYWKYWMAKLPYFGTCFFELADGWWSGGGCRALDAFAGSHQSVADAADAADAAAGRRGQRIPATQRPAQFRFAWLNQFRCLVKAKLGAFLEIWMKSIDIHLRVDVSMSKGTGRMGFSAKMTLIILFRMVFDGSNCEERHDREMISTYIWHK